MANRRAPALTRALPAPVGGWNALDALGAMPAADAVTLINMFPRTTTCQVRFGYSKFATGFGAQLVQTIMAYSGGTTDGLYAIAGGNVYDITAGGATGSAVLSGLSSNRFQYTNISTSGGNYLFMVDGATSAYTFDGTTWANPTITGVTSSTLANVNMHKNRLWFCDTTSLKAWYLPTQSIAGAASALDLSAFAPHGGILQAIGTLTMDAGYGVDDLIVFVTSKGDIIVYRGTDPSSATTWALVGVFQSGTPIGRRCFVKYKGDLLLICQDGLVPLASYIQSSRMDPRISLTYKIQDETANATTLYGSNFGWQVLPFPKENMLILNVPVSVETGQQQFVMNTITGAWANFQGWYACCWELYDDYPYFGANGYVGKAWTTNADATADINYDALQAFNDFGNSGRQKRFTMIRPTLLSNGTPTIYGNVNLDYDTASPVTTLTITPTTYGVWDTGVWDTATWGADLTVTRSWQGANGSGYVGAVRIKGGVNGMQVEWVDTTVAFEPGGIL